MPVGKHVRQQSLHAVQRAIDVEREGFLHQGIVDFEKFGAADGGAGGVEEELDLAEKMLGGVTNDLIRNTSLPIFMSH